MTKWPLSRRTRWLALAGAVAVLGVLSLEAFARFRLGLGTPPLTITDPDIEYMFAPNQDVRRFGNRQFYNAFGMRSDAVPETRPDGEFRVLALGDSILNGEGYIDHEDLATTLLSTNGLRVLNASAGSWGPQNMLAYIDRFGLFDADLLVVVLSSHDAHDVPTFEPLDLRKRPVEPPFLALTEAISRALPRHFAASGAGPGANAPVGSPGESTGGDPQALQAVTELARQPVPTCFVLHPTRDEYRTGEFEAGHAAIRTAAAGAKIVDESRFIRSEAAYRDGIHLTAAGQRSLADAIAACRD